MANMLRANQAARAIYKPKGLFVYGEYNRCLLASVNASDSCQAFAPGGPIGSMESFLCQFCHCHQNVHRRLDVSNHQLPPTPTQQQSVTQRDVKTEESSNNKNANHLGHINAQIFDSPGVSIALVESIMATTTQKWAHSNKKDGGNKRKKSRDEHVVEEYEKEQPQILANQLEWTLNIRLENGKNKKIKKDEDEKPNGFEVYVKTKSKAIKKLHLAQAGESTSSNNHNCPN
ncbi:zinc-finger homeodomain protein 3-like [Solanum stenotomum]|uniref:zinc-finger homeodomain protein 3-like n=1 Tax=Solanum stenotomum TaxID=172797 RepID=UPI0020D1D2FC|nr:zinc-finger homeodomain protein 3-like [Solanum stenotomum]